MKQVKIYRWFTIPALLLVIPCVQVQAQANDTAILHKAGVNYVEHKSYMTIYGDRADTCIESKIQVNEYGLVSNETINYNCRGWDLMVENQFEFDSLRRIKKQITLHNDIIQSEARYRYNERNDVSDFEVLTFDPMMTVEVNNLHYYDSSGRLDSTIQVSKTMEDTTIYTVTYSYNKNGLVHLVKTLNETGKMVYSNQYIYDKSERLTEVNTEIIEPEYSYSKSIFDYNENGQLFTSADTDSGITIERYYRKDGLLAMAIHYNQHGTMVKQVHYVYGYH